MREARLISGQRTPYPFRVRCRCGESLEGFYTKGCCSTMACRACRLAARRTGLLGPIVAYADTQLLAIDSGSAVTAWLHKIFIHVDAQVSIEIMWSAVQSASMLPRQTTDELPSSGAFLVDGTPALREGRTVELR